MSRVGGILYLKIDGNQLKAKGNFTYNLGIPKRESVMGADGVHGFKETPQPAFIEGEITDHSTLDLAALLKTEEATATLELNNGKVIVLRDAFYAADGNAQTEEGNVQMRLESATGNAEEIR